MSGEQSRASSEALYTNRELAKKYYGIALPALRGRQEAINASLAEGEPGFLREAFEWQRGGIMEGLAAQGRVASAQQAAASKGALSGGNFSAGLSAADIGAQLANALYGSKFAEGQAAFDQQLNLMGMALGGAGTAGSGALGAAQNQLQTLGFLPRYNPTYANVMGGLAGAASLYGAYNQWQGLNPQLQLGMMFGGLPAGTTYPTTVAMGTPGMGG